MPDAHNLSWIHPQTSSPQNASSLADPLSKEVPGYAKSTTPTSCTKNDVYQRQYWLKPPIEFSACDHADPRVVPNTPRLGTTHTPNTKNNGVMKNITPWIRAFLPEM
jgi:hypothetical protein